jgi:hypothetical protein
MNDDCFRQFLIQKYQLVPTTTEEIGLYDIYDNYFDWITKHRLKQFCEKTGIKYDPVKLNYELFESEIPAHNAGFLYVSLGARENWAKTHLVLEHTTGYVYSNYDMYSIEAMYAKGVSMDDIKKGTRYGKAYLENLNYLRSGVVTQFREIIDHDFENLQEQIREIQKYA